MPRIARLVVKGEPAVYHVMSRTALDGFVMGHVEKDYLCDLIRKLSMVYFSEVLGFCIMGNHFHLVVRMHPGVRASKITSQHCAIFGPKTARAGGCGCLHAGI